MADTAAAAMPAEPQVAAQGVWLATLGDLLPILERATSGETGIHASGECCVCVCVCVSVCA